MKLSYAIKLLCDSGVPSADYDARELFCHFGGFKRSELYFSDPESENEALLSAISRRAAREPLQYIIGEVGFYGETYRVTPACLIPRADTEALVEYAVKNIPEGEAFLDICTGSGAVGISTLLHTKGTTATLVDISPDALEIAKENAKQGGAIERAKFVLADALTEAVEGEVFAVLSNPPYVSEEEYASLEKEIYFEPRLAFVAEKNGILFYERLTELYRDKIKEGGFIAYEIGYRQRAELERIAKENRMTVEFVRDLSGIDRVAVLRQAKLAMK